MMFRGLSITSPALASPLSLTSPPFTFSHPHTKLVPSPPPETPSRTTPLDVPQIPVVQRLSLNFSHITPTPDLVLDMLNVSPDAGRAVLGFLEWLRINPSFAHSDETISYLVDYFGGRKDFKAIDEILSEYKGRAELGDRTLACVVDRMARAARAVQVVEFFDRMERDEERLRMVVEKLCFQTDVFSIK